MNVSNILGIQCIQNNEAKVENLIYDALDNSLDIVYMFFASSYVLWRFLK